MNMDNDDYHDDSASPSDSDVSGSGMGETTPTSEETEESIAKNETKAVRSLKFVVFAVMILSTIGVALAVYFYISGSETAEFESEFTDAANKVLEGIGASLYKTLGAVDAYTVSIVSFARATNQTWPFVTIPDFAVRTAKVRSLSDSVVISYYPLVSPENRDEWEVYSIANEAWVNESIAIQATDENYYGPLIYEFETYATIHGGDDDAPRNSTRPMLPTWQSSPVVPRFTPFNWDLLSVQYADSIYACIDTHRTIISEAYLLPDPNIPEDVAENEGVVDWYTDFVKPGEDPDAPISDIYYPILDSVDSVRLVGEDNNEELKFVGLISLGIYWRDLLKGHLPTGLTGLVCVIENPCNPSFTYQIDEPSTTYLGRGDLHNPKYDYLVVTSSLLELDSFSVRDSSYSGAPVNEEFCPFTLRAYPSDDMENVYTTSNPIIFTVAAVLIFAFSSLIFIAYDCMVERRQKLVMKTAVQSTAIVSSLFPSVVRDRLYPIEVELIRSDAPKHGLQSFLSDGSPQEHSVQGADKANRSPPIADLFPDTTVMFADIAGFTAWSSVREPAQVFLLLETLYSAFDYLAKKRGVFKVETIGDSYVCVVGLPTPRKHHAVVMARFARDIRSKMADLTREMECTLGPDTGDLKLRIGLNSGPTTAGVLRGEKSRFQLFGDTVNTAARMESNGEKNRIMVSQKTADLLIAAGKDSWLTPRADLVEAKGKGKLQCYWMEPTSGAASVVAPSESAFSGNEDERDDSTLDTAQSLKIERLVDWNLDTFQGLLKNVVTHRVAMCGTQRSKTFNVSTISIADSPLDEMIEIIALPKFNAKIAGRNVAEDVQLSSAVVSQLRSYISVIAHTYRANPFHDFEHASHVAMSTRKLLQRVVSPDVSVATGTANSSKLTKSMASELHDSTYGITSDPLTQFAIVFAALIHDVDHPGVSNAQLVNEKSAIATLYKNKSVAEQNSVAIAWDLLMQPEYMDLQECIVANETELKRFRQLVVNSVMATDVFDASLKAFRESRWKKAFHEGSPDLLSLSEDDTNRRATIVIEYIMQASDVAHTMQHWNVYQKWNKCLFDEMLAAYQAGRADKDPAAGWYEGELWFFDNYIIPLAHKLKECGVFGVSCDEFLDYALDNRVEWESKGRAIVSGWKKQ